MSRILPDLSANVVPLQRDYPEVHLGRPQRYSTEQICDMRRSGKTLDEIASDLGCSLTTVRNHLTKAGAIKPAQRAGRKSRKSVQRHETKIVAEKPASMLPLAHPALTDRRTIYPTTVVSPAEHPRCLIHGKNSRKISGEVQKGTLKGMPIYTLTLEERATCPVSCRHWRSCYGNNMHLAKRFKHGPELERWLPLEVAMLMRAHPDGVLIRLHVVGDFYSVEYVQLWRQMLEEHPNLHVFGFTARIDKGCQICAEIARTVAEHWPRFAIRFSNSPEVDIATVSIEHPLQAPADSMICPAQTGQTESCGTCALCWTSTKRIAFLQH